MQSQDQFAWDKFGTVPNETLEKFGYGSGGNHGRVRDNSGLHIGQANGVAFVLPSNPLGWSQHLATRARQVDTTSTDKAGCTWVQDCDATMNSVE